LASRDERVTGFLLTPRSSRRVAPPRRERAPCHGLTDSHFRARTHIFVPCEAPIPPIAGKVVPAAPNWLQEVKYDGGYRLIVARDGDRVRLFTRNGYHWSSPPFCGEAEALCPP
jgi:ATP-dependent DNA ligase